MSYKNETEFENALIAKLTQLDNQWSREILEYKTEEELIENWAKILFSNNNTTDKLNGCPLTKTEMGQIISQINGETPNTMKDLIKLPGVARKTANVVLWGGFGINEGLAVDTHVKRISGRLGLTKHTDPVDIEKDLVKLFPQSEWGKVNHRMVWFGRHVCDARKPLCDECEMAPFCPKVGVE